MGTTGIEQGRRNGRFVGRDLFRDVIGHLAGGVTVITARHGETDFGITASAVASPSWKTCWIIWKD